MADNLITANYDSDSNQLFDPKRGNVITSAELAELSAELVSTGVAASTVPLAGAQKWFGSAVSGASYNQTTGLSALASAYGAKLEAESDFDAVQLVWVNRAGNAINNCTALVGVTETADTSTANNTGQVVISGTAYGQLAPAGSILGWRSVTWGGAASVNIGAATTAAQYAITDKIPLSSIPRADGGTRPLFTMRLQHDGSADGNFAFLSGVICGLNRTSNTRNRGRFVQVFGGTTLVSVPANNGTLTSACFEVFPIFYYRKPSRTVMVAGDSTEQNDALVLGALTSWGYRGVADVSTTDAPINYLNLGCSGKGSAEYWTRTQEIVNAGIVPDVLVIGPASVNDGYSNLDRTFETARSRTIDIIEYCRSKRIKKLCFIPLFPYNSNSASQDGYRTAFNTYLAALAASIPNVSVLNFVELGNGAVPERWVSGYNVKAGWHYVLFSAVKASTDATSYVSGTTYSATITVDGTACAISFLGSEAATFAALITVLNTQINTGMGTSAVAYVSLDSGNLLIQSNTTGAASTVAITAGTVFAAPLANFSSVSTTYKSDGASDGIHPNETAIDAVMAPALAAALR